MKHPIMVPKMITPPATTPMIMIVLVDIGIELLLPVDEEEADEEEADEEELLLAVGLCKRPVGKAVWGLLDVAVLVAAAPIWGIIVARSEVGATWSAGTQIPPTSVRGFRASLPGSQQKYTSDSYSNMIHDVFAHDGKFTTAV